MVSGHGTNNLVVLGRRITIDATRLSQQQLEILLFHFVNGNEIDGLMVDTRAPFDLVLLPRNPDAIQILLGSAELSTFSFGLDLAGKVHIPAAFSAMASGDGTTKLTVNGVHVAITLPPGATDTALNSGQLLSPIPISASAPNDLYLLPAADGTGYYFTLFDQTVSFNIDGAGHFTGDPAILALLGIHSDAAPYCSAENIRSEQNGWSLTPFKCQRFRQQESTEFVSSPTPFMAPQARLNGPSRAPNQLPPHRKPAGGDPVLGDGEFSIERVDAALAGYGLHYEFRRSYRSGIDTPSPLGAGWQHNFNQRILGTIVSAPGDFSAIGDAIGPNCDGSVDLLTSQAPEARATPG